MCKPLAAPDSPWQVFLIFLRLGLTSFGGPLAHLGYFRQALVVERRWLDEARYAELVALCQFLPGPASSQVGMALGLQRAGYAGALAAWCGFTLPSAVLLIGFALGLQNWSDSLSSGVLQGLKIVTVAVVAQAVWGMGRSLCQGVRRASLMVLACLLILLWPSAWNQLVVIGLAALAGMLWLQAPVEPAAAPGSHGRRGLGGRGVVGSAHRGACRLSGLAAQSGRRPRLPVRCGARRRRRRAARRRARQCRRRPAPAARRARA